MANPSETIARVYAQALFEVAVKTGEVGQVLDDLRVIHALAWAPENLVIREFLFSPRVDRDRKWSAMRSALEGQVCRPVLGLMKVIIDKGREATLDNIAVHFERFRDQAENRLHAHVTVAQPMDEAFRADLVRRLEAESGKTVRLHEQVDENVLGGASIRIGDRIIDRTLRTQLQRLRKSLLARATEDSSPAAT